LTNNVFKDYFEAIKALDLSDATEHTLRPALQNLLALISKQQNSEIKIIHEPKRDASGKGSPDFKFKINEAILGYLENKKIVENLDQTLKSLQIEKYKKLSGNIIITNYLEWVWLRDGNIQARETLCYSNDVGNRKAKLDPEKAEKVAKLIEHFYSTAPKNIARAKDLAQALATRCHDLRDSLLEELIRQEQEHQEGRLWGLYNIFRKDVFQELSVKEFADAFAQTLGYGLFLARLNMQGETDKLTLDNAKKYIPASFELIRELVNFLDEMDKPQYLLAKQPVDEILSIMNMLDIASIHEDLAFTKKQGKLFEDTEEERLLFAKDPYVYFYEDFLKSYDQATRKGRGVYYTPPPVVNYIVRAINDILKDIFGISQGLADRKKVQVLDFATGTGTFLIEILQQIFETVSEGVRDQIIQEHILKNIYGFEYLIAPYTIAHLKLSQFLRDKGYEMKPSERLQIYLTNTLEPISPQSNFLLPALSREAQDAQAVKDKPILVITGNPPYSGESKNKGKWISDLVNTYKFVDGKPLGEKNSKWLNDDYVKFIRFAQDKIDKVDEGIVGIITSHSFIDNPTFRGMRQSLMQTFDQIHIMDLHGNSKKKENAPDGSKDENVFDIEQGVAIAILVKNKKLKKAVFHSDLFGKRKSKYKQLLEENITQTDWKNLTPNTPNYLFIPQDQTMRAEYEQGWKITDIFPVNSVGIVTARDDLAIHFTEEEIKKVINDFSTLSIDHARTTYNLGEDSRDWKVELAQKDIIESGISDNCLVPINYRPFDIRYTLYTGKSRGFHCMPRGEVMRHMIAGDNIGIAVSRQFGVIGEENFDTVTITDSITDLNLFRRGGNNLFPLYLYNFPNDKKPKTDLFGELEDNFTGKERIENLSPEFRKFIDKKYGKHYSPEQILDYIYAVLHSPTYRSKYIDFLKIDFPHIPFVETSKIFEQLCAIGSELVQAHLLKSIPDSPKIEITKGNMTVEKPVYLQENGRLYINKEQYFSTISKEIWEFHIGGYQVLDKYLKSRKGRTLTLDEIENVQNIVKVLTLTLAKMQEIDAIWQA